MPVGFQIAEELQNQTGGKIGHGQPLDRFVEVLADIGQKQAERIPIAGAGVLGQIPFSYDIFDEEAPQPRATATLSCLTRASLSCADARRAHALLGARLLQDLDQLAVQLLAGGHDLAPVSTITPEPYAGRARFARATASLFEDDGPTFH